MLNDERFGLPLSLGEALRADPSREAAQLAQLLQEEEPPRREQDPHRRRDPAWRKVMAGVAAAATVGAMGHAANARPTGPSLFAASSGDASLIQASLPTTARSPSVTPPTAGLEGRWTMAPAQSRFREAVTGPAPDYATMTVSRDDPGHLAYVLVERRGGEEVARGAYALSFGGAASTTEVDGADLQVTAARTADGGVVIQAPPVGALRAVIRVRRTGPDTAVLEHDVEEGGHAIEVERISLVRSADM